MACLDVDIKIMLNVSAGRDVLGRLAAVVAGDFAVSAKPGCVFGCSTAPAW
ncbi:predicted protein [Sclerotinia sclerotiorum 1980 UF-70]|uniref:Uncharacterized protein n=1 Tax=Sclerotinia sclerotiorum (strain ATCC 18683 / 1980 / Ss-1) TaxID=665079 RepID=A7E9E8_SCLS1|nr:predicted protein [Sclerotinia sclerotiorum 1980 UF-70]EDN97000.1 predicted protein [Sclerotinia sclerotiorum 1980 UF-70]